MVQGPTNENGLAREEESRPDHPASTFRRLVENPQAHYFFWRHDPDGRFTYVSPSMTGILGYTREAFVTQEPKKRPQTKRTMEAQRRTKLSRQGQQQPPYLADTQRADGTPCTLEVFEVPVFDEGGNVVAVEGLAHDVTQHQKTLEELKDSEERYKDLVEKAGIAILIDDEEGNPVFCNETFLRLYDYSQEEIVKQTIDTLVHPGDRDMLRGYHRARIAGENPPSRYRFRGITRQGNVRHFELDTAPLFKDGVISGTHAYMWDVTETVHLEEELLRSRDHLEELVREKTQELRDTEEKLRLTQRLKAIGTLAGGIAHDFNNLLTSILGYADVLTYTPDDPDEVRAAAKVIRHAAKRGAELTHQMLGFARRGKLQNAPLDVHRSIENVMAILCRTVDKRIEISMDLQAPRPVIKGDPGQIEEVFLNLAVNARDAMPEGGCLGFQTEVILLNEKDCPQDSDCHPGEMLAVTVHDTGRGIPREHHSRLFEPFFTTKGPGEGTGMGLAMAWGIVKNHGGLITVDSKVGQGSRFRVLLPLCDEVTVPEEPDEPDPRSLLAVRPARVLVIDDEPHVCGVFTQALSRLGHKSVCMEKPGDALERLKAEPHGFDLVVLDMIMPELSGREVFDQIISFRPGLPVVLCTGHAGADGVDDMLERGLRGVLRKPFSTAALAQTVNLALEGSEPAAREEEKGRSG